MRELNKMLTEYYKRDFTILNLILASKKASNKMNFLIIYENNNIIGFSRYKYIEDITISTVIVNTKYRKKGVCSMMIKLLLDLIKQNHKNKNIILHVEKDNIGAIKCYKKNNFEIKETNKYGAYTMIYKN